MPTRIHVAIRGPGDGRMVVLADGSLPAFERPEPGPWQVVRPVVDAIRGDFGLDVGVLRPAWVQGAEASAADGMGHRLYEAEVLGGSPPAGTRWAEPEAIAGGWPTIPAQLSEAIAMGALEPAAGDRQPWYRPGWLAAMSDWVDGRLADAGIRRRGPVRQERSWGRAAVLSIDTDRGRLWAKAVPVVFAHEVAVTELLADIDPGVVPPVVAADGDLGRIITEHVDGSLLPTLRDPAAWAATLSRLAELQRVLGADPTGLVVAGVADAPLDELADAVPRLLGDDSLLLTGRPGGLSSAEAGALRTRIPELAAACRSLGDSRVPVSLEHGDLTPDQVIIGEMGPVFLDWSDGSVTHPFLSAVSIIGDGATRDAMADRPSAVAEVTLVEAYLGPWLAGDRDLSRDDARGALDLARMVLPLHLAALYADRILPGLEQPWEMERAVPRFLRSILPG